MKLSISAPVALAAALLAGATQASTPVVVNLIGVTGGTFAGGISHTVSAAGSFEDIYTLGSNTGLVSVNGTLSTQILNSGSADIDISSVTLNGVSFSQALIPFRGNPDGREQYALPVTQFSGPLTLVVKGTLLAGNNGSTIGAYTANFSVAPVASPVPEPETYALFAAGLAAVGFIARRRRSV